MARDASLDLEHKTASVRIRLYVQLAAESSATRQSRASRQQPTVGQTVLPARHSAFVLKREEAKQADRPSQAKPMASQELGSLINFATQDQYEKAGERIHNRFEISDD